MDITVKKIEESAPNAAAAKNGKDLVSKKKFSNLKIDNDQTIIWGECAGSGKNPYICSADFVEEHNPVFRCNCPSRQFPCKHCLGLMYAFAQGETFSAADIPEEITSKRAKIEKKQEKKVQERTTLKEKAETPKKINKSAVIKKAETQLAGIELASKILNNIVQAGLSSIDKKEERDLQSRIKELGNYYINGIQTAFNNLILELNNVQNNEYTFVIDQINYISALLKKGTEHLNNRKLNPEAPNELNSAIEEQIGYTWKLTELIQNELWEENAELIQLSFNSYDNKARKEYVDEGAWINLKNGRIYKTKNFRPYKAIKYIKEDNSTSDAILLQELYIYPGDMNPRIRWESEARTDRKINEKDLQDIQSYAANNYAEIIKTVKNTIKDPLKDKNPLILISLHRAYQNGDHIVIEDKTGTKLTLCDSQQTTVSTEANLKLILPPNPEGMTLLAMINNNIQTGLLSVQPLSLISSKKITKLLY